MFIALLSDVDWSAPWLRTKLTTDVTLLSVLPINSDRCFLLPFFDKKLFPTSASKEKLFDVMEALGNYWQEVIATAGNGSLFSVEITAEVNRCMCKSTSAMPVPTAGH